MKQRKKKILMLGTGGTIASSPTGDGLKPSLPSEEILSYIPQVTEFCEPAVRQVFSIDSTNMGPEHWTELAAIIEKEYDSYDGFVVSHGTDTMAYTAAALSYLIQNSDKPIVLTGAQKPIDREITDAKTNLLDAFCYAAEEESRDVVIVFDGKVIAGTRGRKERAKSYHAFSSLNFPYLAVIQDQKVIRYLPSVPVRETVRFSRSMRNSLYVLKVIPGMKADILEVLFEKYDCIVIESFGVGGIPEKLAQGFYEQMEKWKGRGKILVMTTQAAGEGSNMTVYEVGRKVKRDFQIIEAYDMTLEAVTAKLMWLMAAGKQEEEWLRREFYRTVNYDILFKGPGKTEK